jgi:hypothetical protein
LLVITTVPKMDNETREKMDDEIGSVLNNI